PQAISTFLPPLVGSTTIIDRHLLGGYFCITHLRPVLKKSRNGLSNHRILTSNFHERVHEQPTS
ncbi:unnamed protein product, partial [Brassica rapa subsp. narinosa]